MEKDLTQRLLHARRQVAMLGGEHLSLLYMLEEEARKTRDPKTAPRLIEDVLATGGYEARLTKDAGPLSFEVRTDQRLNGITNLGHLVPINPPYEMLSPQERTFYEAYAKRAGMILDHAMLYENRAKVLQATKLLLKTADHEIKNHQTKLRNGMSFLRRETLSPKGAMGMRLIQNGTKGIEDLLEIQQMGTMTQEQLRRNAEVIDLKNPIREQIWLFEEETKSQGIAIDFYHQEEGPLEVTMYKPFFRLLVSVKLQDALKRAEEESSIRIAIGERGERVNLSVENSHHHEIERAEFGESEGTGSRFLDLAALNLHGERRNYLDTEIMGHYTQRESIGTIQQERTWSNFWGAEFSFPKRILE